ncbi:GNAT family N-acetyltransferase [Terrabacter terrigena]|uniref:Enhanced intracellular survival protein Eis n=1 Tax=Terrabacter terrigena TaxID=574718 RepID=A0ABW3N504_9MICO
MSELRTRDVVDADLPAVLSIRNRSFGPLGVGGEDWWSRVSAETLGGRMIAVVDESDRVLGAGRMRPFEQAWGGRHLRMGGVAGVYVEPSARGTGVATTLTRALIARMGELGDVVSCLFPTTASLYRRSGYEIGGFRTRTTYAGHLLRELGSARAGRAVAAGGSGARPASPEDAQLMQDLAREAQARHGVSGPMVPTTDAFRGMLERDELIGYVVADGFVVYDLSDGVVTVEHLVAGSAQSAAALWGLVGSGSSAAPTVHTYLDPRDPVTLALGGMAAYEVHQTPWMGRVIDLAAAFGNRGFGAHTSVVGQLVADDPDAPANTGAWSLAVSAGRGTATRDDVSAVDGSALRVGARGLSALWCGWSVSRLRQAGLASGGSPEGDAALDAVFTATPYITEYF